MAESPGRIKDAQGHEWPVTGFWCTVCGMPLHPTLQAAGVHLNCEVRQAGRSTSQTNDPSQRHPPER